MSPDKLFEANTPLVGFIYQKHFSMYPAHHEDLMQEGYIGLWKACCGFDESRGTAFSTYACPAIKFAMLYYVRKHILKHACIISLETVIAEDGEGSKLFLADTLCEQEDRSDKELIELCVTRLSKRDKSIVQSLMAGFTQIEAAELFGVSQPTVSRCLARLKKIILEEYRK